MFSFKRNRNAPEANTKLRRVCFINEQKRSPHQRRPFLVVTNPNTPRVMIAKCLEEWRIIVVDRKNSRRCLPGFARGAPVYPPPEFYVTRPPALKHARLGIHVRISRITITRHDRQRHCNAPKNRIEAQRSGFDSERRSDEVNERWRLLKKEIVVANDTKSATTWYAGRDSFAFSSATKIKVPPGFARRAAVHWTTA